MGAVGETALTGCDFSKVSVAAAGPIAFYSTMLWQEFGLNKVSNSKYQKVSRKCRAGALRDLALVGPFTSVAVVSHPAQMRQIAIKSFEGAAAIFAVALQGVAIIVDNAQSICTVLQAGEAGVFCPDAPIRVEVEGASSLLLIFSCTAESSGAPSKTAKRRTTELQSAADTAKAAWAGSLRQEGVKVRRQRRLTPECEDESSQDQGAPPKKT